MTIDPSPFLAPLSIESPEDRERARDLARQISKSGRDLQSQVDLCFRWVRDHVAHTVDAGGGPVTCTPAEVLREKTGYCYAKSQLLVALLRGLQIPAALCYQRLRREDDDPSGGMCLHGLAAAFLPEHGWVRLDPRGDRPGICTRFAPPDEHLAFPVAQPGECDLPGLYAQPLDSVLAALTQHTDWRSVLAQLPDRALPANRASIRWARHAELARLQQVEMAAGERFRAEGLASVADAPGLPLAALAAARRLGQLFVAEAQGKLAGFCLVQELDGEGHLVELSVVPECGGQGIGSELLAYACVWAKDAGFQSMTLATFRDVPFNAPFYARRGFVPIAPEDEGPGLCRKRDEERARGLEGHLRLAMRLPLA